MQINKLNALKIKSSLEKGRYSDGGGLYLQVSKFGTKSWLFVYKRGGKPTSMGLGTPKDVSLARARELAAEFRRVLLEGRDPMGERREAEERRQAAIELEARAAQEAAKRKAVTFRTAAEQYIKSQSPSWKNRKHKAQWESTLQNYAHPVIGAKPVSEVTTADVIQILNPIWDTKAETANRLRGRIELILNWAKAMGHYHQENPARWNGHLSHLLPKQSRIARIKHFAALPYSKISGFMAELAKCDGVGAKALEFTILTACRSGEVTKARWSEFNLKDRVWTIPAERMKAGKEHTVPLTEAAIRILREVEPFGDDFVFASPRTGGEISDATMRAVLKRMGFPDLTVHGFRSTFRDWASETTNHAHQVCEMALAHTIENRAEAAYRRGDLKDKRRVLMDDWAQYLYCYPSVADRAT